MTLGITYVKPGDFDAYLNDVKKRYGSYRLAAQKLGINSAYFTLALQGRIYKRLLRALNITITKPRPRLIINCPYETIARFHRLQGDMTTGQLLEVLMDKAEGIGVIE